MDSSPASRDQREFGLVFEAPPGATLRVDEKAWLQLSLWIYWLRIAWLPLLPMRRSRVGGSRSIQRAAASTHVLVRRRAAPRRARL